MRIEDESRATPEEKPAEPRGVPPTDMTADATWATWTTLGMQVLPGIARMTEFGEWPSHPPYDK